MLKWNFFSNSGNNVHTGIHKGEVYARVFRDIDGKVGYQFKGLRGADVNGDYYREAESVEMAQKICQGMMAAWAHEAA